MAASSAALSFTASDVLEWDKDPRFLTQLSIGGQDCYLGSYRHRQIPETAELQPVACLHDLTDRTVQIGEPRFPVFADVVCAERLESDFDRCMVLPVNDFPRRWEERTDLGTCWTRIS